MTTSTVNLEGVKHVYSVGSTKIYSAKVLMAVLGVNSVAAVIAAAKKAQINQRERDGENRWLFTAKDVEIMAHRPGRGRPLGTGHPNSPRKAKAIMTNSTGGTNVMAETPVNTDAVTDTTSAAIAVMDVDTDGAVHTESYN